MEIYSVGGAVRDTLLALPVSDRDYVVVGATPNEMLALGFKAVGRDFPVFLHPVTHEEYALARTERKTAPGYKGFAFHADPSVTLLEDLARRDLTINAMAQDAAGEIVDPFGGQKDLQAGVLRHVGPAFAEDPVRILRIARFAARFTRFVIDPTTMALMRQMVAAGEVDALVPERVWQELSRGLMETCPSRMFDALAQCGALERIAPQAASKTGAGLLALDRSAIHGRGLSVRCAVWLGAAGLDAEQLRQLAERLRLPSDCVELSLLTIRERVPIVALNQSSAQLLLDLIERCDALRRRERFEELLLAVRDLEDSPLAPQCVLVHAALEAVRQIDAGKIAEGLARPEIPKAIRAARLAALEAVLH